MVGKALGSLVALAVLLALPASTSAQVQSWKDVQVADIEQMKDKWIALAGAFDESDYDWRPMEDVRSVREVLGLAISEANLFPGMWGAAPGPGAAGSFPAEMQRTAALSQADMIAALESSFDHLAGVVRDMDAEKRRSDANWFGTDMRTSAHIATAMADMHEHLGQLIAYARTNHVVPPWSAGN